RWRTRRLLVFRAADRGRPLARRLVRDLSRRIRRRRRMERWVHRRRGTHRSAPLPPLLRTAPVLEYPAFRIASGLIAQSRSAANNSDALCWRLSDRMNLPCGFVFFVPSWWDFLYSTSTTSSVGPPGALIVQPGICRSNGQDETTQIRSMRAASSTKPPGGTVLSGDVSLPSGRWPGFVK